MIGNVETLDNILQQLKALKSLVNNIKIFKQEKLNKEIQSFLNQKEDEKEFDLRAFCLYNEIADDVQEYNKKNIEMKSLIDQKNWPMKGNMLRLILKNCVVY